ncbi:MAG: sulfatase [Bacteroidetes bacterium]|nr:sulfatase [Bacteroidota bacterium]MDA0860998.1 sulfatase [Bacteroidota bacterium]MDA1319268.1 sulfatase [Bacteroidota bacterium]
MKTSQYYLYLIVLFSFFWLQAQDSSTSPNFIFYLADDQDLLDYGIYGNPKVHTPAVDALAKEGMRFTNFYTSQAICAPSRSQIFTGMYPLKNGCMANHLPVKPNLKTVIDYMKAEGYEVVLAGKGHVKPNSVFQWSKYFKSVDNRYLPLDKLENYLENIKKPFCVFITSDFPHGPYPKISDYTNEDIYRLPYDSGNIRKLKTGYYQNIRDDNAQLERVLEIVETNGLVDNSIFIYASDHGISGKWGVSEQGLKVPFIVRWPGVVEANSVSETILNFVDILPTFLDIIGADIPQDLDGNSFQPTLKGNTDPIHDYIFSLSTKQNIQKCKVFPSRAIRGKRFKFIRNYNSIEVVESNYGSNSVINAFIRKGAESFPNVPFEELYDLELDPYQEQNLINNPEYLEQKNRLSSALENWMIAQNDFLIHQKMPLIKPTLHPLDRNSKWNKVDEDLVGKIDESSYIILHY